MIQNAVAKLQAMYVIVQSAVVVAGTIHRSSATVEEEKKFVKAAKPEVL